MYSSIARSVMETVWNRSLNSGEYENILNCYHIIFTLKDYIDLNERLYYEEKDVDETVETSDEVI